MRSTAQDAAPARMARAFAWRRLPTAQLVVDIVVPAVLALLALPLAAVTGAGSLLVLAGMAAAAMLRRLNPLVALIVAWVVCLAQVFSGQPPHPANVAVLVALYSTAAYGTALTRWLGFASSFVGAAIVTIYLVAPLALDALTTRLGDATGIASVLLPSVMLFGGSLTLFLLSWTLGILAQTWRRARQNRLDAELAAREIAIEQERTRIARDMHDIVAHSLAVVVAQADGARYIGQTNPAAVDAALATIASTSREALADVRVLLEQLRHRQAEGPQPGLADLDRLLAQVEAAGLTIERHTTGESAPLSTAQQLAVYRVVQESLTNALRHADAARPISLRFDWAAHGLAITVSSALNPHGRDAREPHAPPTLHRGHGIPGMTERMALIGGTLTAAPDGDRFVVRAWLPVASAQGDLAQGDLAQGSLGRGGLGWGAAGTPAAGPGAGAPSSAETDAAPQNAAPQNAAAPNADGPGADDREQGADA